MKKPTVFIIFVIILFSGLLPTSIGFADSPNYSVFYGDTYNQIQEITQSSFPHYSGALRTEPGSSTINTMTNALTVSTLIAEYRMGGSKDVLNSAHKIIDTSTKYFGEVFLSDSRGWVSYYDFTKEDNSYVRGRKFTHDQFLMMLGLAESYQYLDENDAKKSDYLVFVVDTESFIEEYFLETDEKWIDSLFIYNETLYTKNRFRLIENICWTIWAAVSIPSAFSSPITLDAITKVMDFIDENGTLNGTVYNIMNPTGEFTDNIFKLKTNALYGYINLLVYEKTEDSKYLNRAKRIYDFLVNNLWDKGFKGFFDQTDASGLKLVQGKSLSGNTLACLLASNLLQHFPSNISIMSNYVLTNRFIENLLSSNIQFKYHISCDRDGGNRLNRFTLESNLIRLWQRVNSLHLVNGSLPQRVSIGEKINIDLSLSNPHNLNYTVFVTGDEINSFNLSSQNSHLNLQIPLKKNAGIGYTTIKIEIKVMNEIIDKSSSIEITIGSDRRLPQGFVYLIALGILVIMVILARYPPKALEDLLIRLSTISLSEKEVTEEEEQNNNSSKEEKVPQSEEEKNGE